MNDRMKYMLQFVDDNYFPLIHYHLNEDRKIVLGNENTKVCRFCKKTQEETTFDNVAHVLPEFIGNKKLISNYECDNCNHKFSRLLENHMANYMNLWHRITQIKGKKSVPSFKTINNKSRIDIGFKHVEISEHTDDSITNVDPKRKTITISAKKRSYIPIAIYKALTKMALTIMPENELDDFRTTMAWINEENHTDSQFNIDNLIVLKSIAGGMRPIPFVSCMLFKRKESHKDSVPNMIFVLAYSNFIFQIYIPMCSSDFGLIGKEVVFTFFPSVLDLQGIHLTRKKIDMSSKEKVVNEEENIEMQFESMKEIPIDYPQEAKDI